MKTNTPPVYTVEPSIGQDGERIPHNFNVLENGSFCFRMDNRGDRFQEILKRGIPMDQARSVFYAMDGQ